MASPNSLSKPRPARLTDDSEFRSRLSSWSNKQHQDQSKAGIILWLQESFETGCKESMAKEDVYLLYAAHCKEESTEPLRASMFGKLVHRAFPGLKSSRIGTRGATRHSYKSFRRRGVPTAQMSPSHTAVQLPAARQTARWQAPGAQGNSQVICDSASCSEASSNPSSPFPSDNQDEVICGQLRQNTTAGYYESPQTMRAGDSSPASFPSPTLPFDTFAYTSEAFSPFLGASASAAASTNRLHDCPCDECLQRERRPAPQAPTLYANPIGYGGRSDYGGYWASQSSDVARQIQPQVGVVDDYLFRDLGISIRL